MGGIPSWARVGAKVALIDNSPGYLDGYVCKNTARVFTLSEIYVEFGRVGCRVSEWRYGPFEYTNLARFRPLVTDSETLGIEAQFYRAKSRKSKAPARESEPVQ